MISGDRVKVLAALLFATLILAKPFLVVLFQGFVYSTDLNSVYLSSACIGTTTQTVYVFCLLEVLIACVLIKNYVVPAIFADRWQTFDELKQRKMVGFVIKIVVRLICLLQLCTLVAPRFSLIDGMFSNFNVKQASINLVTQKRLTTCADAGMALSDAAALRAWTFTRDDLMAVMVWELAFIPELPWDAWLHHIFVILAVTLGTDPQMLGSNAQAQPFIDGFAFFLCLGATTAALVEICVLMYHIAAPNASKQAFWMSASITIQSFLILVLFMMMPVILIATHWAELGGMSYLLIALVVFLTFVELKMVAIKRVISAKSRAKAARGAQDVAAIAQISLLGSFSHNIDHIQNELAKSCLEDNISPHPRTNLNP